MKKFLKNRWVLIIISLVYLISPIDIIPDFLLPGGIADDVIVFLLLLREIVLLYGEQQKRKRIEQNSKLFDTDPEIVDGELVE